MHQARLVFKLMLGVIGELAGVDHMELLVEVRTLQRFEVAGTGVFMIFSPRYL